MIDFSSFFFFLSIVAVCASAVLCVGIFNGFVFKLGKIKIELMAGRNAISDSEFNDDYGGNHHLHEEEEGDAIKSDQGISKGCKE